MARFEDAIDTILEHEGGFVDHPNDPGGATNWGIALRDLVASGDLSADFDHDGDVDAADIRHMPRTYAVDRFRRFYWEPHGYTSIDDQKVATKVFDMCVNMGSFQAHKLLQRALSACDMQVEVDGRFGQRTLAAVNRARPDVLLQQLREQCAKFYHGLVLKKPKFEVFLKGWLRRAYS